MFSFSQETKYESPNSLVPAGTLAYALLKVKALKNSNNTGGEYADVELVLMGQYENRRIFTMVANPADERNKDNWRQMGLAAIQHVLEVAGVFKLGDDPSYKQFANNTFAQILRHMDGKRCAIKVKIEKGKDGHQDKNAVAEWLSPNPNSGGFKGWNALNGTVASGDNAAAQTGFLSQSAPANNVVASQAQVAGVVSGNAPDWLK